MPSHKKLKSDTPYKKTIPKEPATMSTVWREGCGDACVSTPMKIPRTTNEKYAIIRAEEEQRRRKTSVKREETVTPTACRRIMLAPDVAIQTIQIPCGDTSHASQTHTPCGDTSHASQTHTPCGDTSFPHTPLPGSNSTPSATTPHARPFESQPNSPW